MIEVRNLAKYYGRFTALRDLNLTIRAGECVALFGKNGAGKSTFLRILAGLTRPSSGSCAIHLPDRPAQRYVRGTIGYLSHHTSLYADLTALENLRFFASLMQVRTQDDWLIQRIAQVGLEGRELEPVRNYSRGMQQRLAIARAFLHDPALLLLDEPFTGLDQAGYEFLKSYVQQARARGCTCIMALHDTQLGYDMADRLVVIDGGVAALDMATAAIPHPSFQERYTRLLENRPQA